MSSEAPLGKAIAVSVTVKLIILALIGVAIFLSAGQNFYALLCVLAAIAAALLCRLAYF